MELDSHNTYISNGMLSVFARLILVLVLAILCPLHHTLSLPLTRHDWGLGSYMEGIGRWLGKGVGLRMGGRWPAGGRISISS